MFSLSPEGSVVVGGTFTSIAGVAANGVALYNPISNTWSALGSGVSGGTTAGVSTLAVFPNGDIVAGGSFSTAGGGAALNIARFDRAAGAWAPMGAGLDRAPAAVSVMANGDVIAAGMFTNAGGVGVKYVARYNVASESWSALGSGIPTLTGSDLITSVVALQNGTVIVGGIFRNTIGLPTSGLMTFDVATNSWSGVVTAYQNLVYGLAKDSDGGVLVAGALENRGMVAKLDPSTHLVTPIPSAYSSPARAGQVLPLLGGDLVASGTFSTIDGIAARGIAIYSPSTRRWTATTPGFNGAIRCTTRAANGDVIAGGEFTSAANVAANFIARYSPFTNTWSALGEGTNGQVLAVAELSNRDVLAGGLFYLAGGVPVTNLARFRAATNSWSGLPGWDGSAVRVNAMATRPDGSVIIGGRFYAPSGVATGPNLAVYSPDTETWSALGGGNAQVSDEVYTIAMTPDGDVLVGGKFRQIGSLSANHVARYAAATRSWASLGAGLDYNEVLAITALPNGDVLAGGWLLRVNPPIRSLGRYSRATNQWSNVGTATSGSSLGYVRSLCGTPDGKVLVAGQFDQIEGIAARGVALYDPVNNSWSQVGTGIGGSLSSKDVYTVTTLANGDVAVGGDFTIAGRNTSASFARFGTPVPLISRHPMSVTSCPSGVASLSVVATSDSAVSYQWRKDGNAIDLATNPSAATATLSFAGTAAADEGVYDCVVTNGCGSATSLPAVLTVCTGDFNCDGGADGADIEAFFAAWGAGAAVADINADGGVNGADIGAFFDVWVQGC
ncbi:MAG: hypothetical protein JSR77_14400 [Planctomycetes bacterium]|nr:hypothetical protein [Planctomycetota bacterium]